VDTQRLYIAAGDMTPERIEKTPELAQIESAMFLIEPLRRSNRRMDRRYQNWTLRRSLVAIEQSFSKNDQLLPAIGLEDGSLLSLFYRQCRLRRRAFSFHRIASECIFPVEILPPSGN
jgi:hypothetical protein